MGFSKTRTVHFAMDTTTGNLNKDLAIMDNIQSKLNNAGITVERHSSSNVTKGRGPGAMYNNMAYLADNNIHDAIMLHLMNGVDPSNIREVSYFGKGGNDNRGNKARKNGNDVILAWFYGACDCVHPGGSCYNSVRGSETGSRMYNPLQVMEQNGIKAICERTDYNGDKIAEAVIALFDDTNTQTTETSETSETNTPTDKTLRSETIEKTYTKANYSIVLTVKTDENGGFSLPVNLPIAGKYIADYNFAGDKDYLPSTMSTTIDNQKGELFQRKLLQTKTIKDYGTNETETTVEGNTNGYEHTLTEKTVKTYENGNTKTEIIIIDDDKYSSSPIARDNTADDTGNTTAGTTIVTTGGKDPYTTIIGVNSNGTPKVNEMKTGNKTYEMVNTNKTYTLTTDQYFKVFNRDSQIMQIQDYTMSAYTCFECEEEPNKIMVIERERWNAIEEAWHYYMVKGKGKKKFSVIPYPKMVIDFPNKRSTFDGSTINWKSEKCNIYYVADNQNTGYTCGPTACSVCTQVLHKYYSERNLQELIHATSSSGSSYTTHAEKLRGLGFTASVYNGIKTAVSWLKERKPCVWHVHWHYVALTDIAENGDILVLNSTSSSGYGPFTGWRTQTTVKNANGGSAVKIGLNWNISSEEKQRLQNFYQNMGGKWNKKENKNEKVRYYQLSY